MITQSKQHSCYACGRDCTKLRYHNSKAAPLSAPGKSGAVSKHDLCAPCYAEGRFPSSNNAADYTKLENDRYNTIADRAAPWTDAELLLLLEALELFDEDWDAVSDHVGTRPREECVLKFLQLEIEDSYLDAPSADKSNEYAYLANGRTPLSHADNPVMSVMSFLAGLADPGVTAAAAGRSVDEMKRHLKDRLEKQDSSTTDTLANTVEKNGTDGNGTLSSGNVKDENAMDLDGATAESQKTSPATLALSLTAARSAALATHTERHLTALVSSAVNLQIQKMEMKMTHFAEMESLLAAERRELERQRQRLFLDRLAFKKRVKELEDRFGAQVKIDAEVLDVKTVEGEVVPPNAADAGFKRHEI